MTTVYLALGSNLGDRAALIAGAVAQLDARGVTVDARSPLYETDAVADEPQPPYLNAVVRATTALPAGELLARCLEIERMLGRTRPPGRPKAARIIDIDLLLYGDQVIGDAGAAAGEGAGTAGVTRAAGAGAAAARIAATAAEPTPEPTLIVPHPGLLGRPFVRIPLADVAAPGLRHPLTGDALDRVEDSPGVRRLL